MKIEINLDPLEHALHDLIDRIENRSGLMRALASDMHNAVEDNFQAEGRPAWLGWSRAYAKRRAGGEILQKTGRLAASIKTLSDNDTAVVGTNVKYAKIHHYGGTIKKEARQTTLHYKQYKDGTVGNRFVKKRSANFTQHATIGAHSVKMPARPFLTLTDDDHVTLIDTCKRYFQSIID